MNNESLEESGYVILKGIITEEQIRSFEMASKRAYDSQISLLNGEVGVDLFDSMKSLYSSDYDRYSRTTSSLWRMVESGDFFHSKRLIESVNDILGTESLFLPGGLTVHVMAEELKFKGGYFGFPAHQDYPSIGGSLDGIVVWIPIYDVDENNFPVEIIPGSHKSGMWESEKFEYSSAIISDLYSEDDFFPVCCESGDAVIMSNFLVHRSSTKGDERLRLAISNRFCNGLESSFIDRVYPTSYIRSVNRLDAEEVKKIIEDKNQ